MLGLRRSRPVVCAASPVAADGPVRVGPASAFAVEPHIRAAVLQIGIELAQPAAELTERRERRKLHRIGPKSRSASTALVSSAYASGAVIGGSTSHAFTSCSGIVPSAASTR